MLLVLIGCTSPDAPDVDSPHDVYHLVSVDGEAVPTTRIASGFVRLNDGGTFVDYIRFASSGLSGNFTHTGFYVPSDTSVELTYSDQRPVVADTLALVNDVLVRRDCDGLPQCPMELVYRRSRE